jgi:hypothetical protein
LRINIFFQRFSFFSQEDDASSFLDIVTNGYDYDADKGVSLFSWDAIKHSDSEYMKKIRTLSSNKEYKEYKELLATVSKTVEYCEQYITDKPLNLRLYRVRIGADKFGEPNEFSFRPSMHFKPYENGDIGAAPIEFVTKGRMNRDGFSFLYLAEDYDTALHEVKPYPNDKVSVGVFKQDREIKIADFTKLNIFDFYLNDNQLKIFEELYHLGKFISNPISSSENYQYLYTQLISEELIRKEFDGIKFSSSITGKACYAIFATTSFKYDASEKYVFNITKFQLEYDKLPLMKEEKE